MRALCIVSCLLAGACHASPAVEPVTAAPAPRHHVAPPPPPTLPDEQIDGGEDVAVVLAELEQRAREQDADHSEGAILDVEDRCPDSPGDGADVDDGCPEIFVHVELHPSDESGDILDVEDRCPDEPEDGAGFEDIDGCPEPARASVL